MLWKGFENKSHQRRAHCLHPPRNGRCLSAGGGSLSHPPALLGLTLVSVGGAPQAPPSRYRSAISTWFEIMSSPLVTFNFKMFPKHSWTQFLNFLAQIWEIRVRRQEVSIDFEKKNEKIWFFQFFLKQIILFLFEIEFYMKNAFFRGIACWNSSKITKFRNFAHI